MKYRSIVTIEIISDSNGSAPLPGSDKHGIMNLIQWNSHTATWTVVKTESEIIPEKEVPKI